jgi:succinate dehydrogenase flavin-adding protein (antitoxin of CptAB toxin-antitoxin module)
MDRYDQSLSDAQAEAFLDSLNEDEVREYERLLEEEGRREAFRRVVGRRRGCQG